MLASGIVVPCLMIGGCFGRAVGVGICNLANLAADSDFLYTDTWAWLDPGALALLGSAAFFGGVSRLTVSLLVIMVEISNDVHSVLPMMLAVMTAKRIADSYTHGLYHAILEMKCVPFLDGVPYHPQHDLDLYQLKDVMTRGVLSIRVLAPASSIRDMLLSCQHQVFAVVNSNNEFLGSIARASLEVLLQTPSVYGTATEGSKIVLEYSQMANEWSGEAPSENPASRFIDRSSQNHGFEMIPSAMIDLEPYLNSSAYCLPEVFSLKQAYNLFRAMGLRHLFVLDHKHHCMGVRTRKDFIGHDMETRLPSFPNTKFSNQIVSTIQQSMEQREHVKDARETIH